MPFTTMEPVIISAAKREGALWKPHVTSIQMLPMKMEHVILFLAPVAWMRVPIILTLPLSLTMVRVK